MNFGEKCNRQVKRRRKSFGNSSAASKGLAAKRGREAETIGIPATIANNGTFVASALAV